jgi:hypothetical protein
VTIELWQQQRLLQSVVTDCFGEFKFDGLEPHSGTYTVRLLANNTEDQARELEMAGESIVMQDIVLQRPKAIS